MRLFNVVSAILFGAVLALAAPATSTRVGNAPNILYITNFQFQPGAGALRRSQFRLLNVNLRIGDISTDCSYKNNLSSVKCTNPDFSVEVSKDGARNYLRNRWTITVHYSRYQDPRTHQDQVVRATNHFTTAEARKGTLPQDSTSRYQHQVPYSLSQLGRLPTESLGN